MKHLSPAQGQFLPFLNTYVDKLFYLNFNIFSFGTFSYPHFMNTGDFEQINVINSVLDEFPGPQQAISPTLWVLHIHREILNLSLH